MDLVSSDYVGRPVSEVQAELTTLGFVVSISPQETSDVAEGLVNAVMPDGALPPNSPVTLNYAVAPPPPPAPAPTPAATSAGDSAGQDENEPDEDESDQNTGGRRNWDGSWDGNGNGGGNGNGRWNG
ncbi:MAG: Two component serine/threonine protein kinase with sensor(S) [Modestobacter sp.]|nr:Two component serine/threonine protein kinase with sensor(S) [Modestobacter sp.]